MKKRNYCLRYTCVLLILGTLFFMLESCAVKAMPDYRSTAFRAEIRYEMHEMVITAEIHAGNIVSNVGVKRDVELNFTSPPELAGLCVRRVGGEVNMIRGETVVPITDIDSALPSLAAVDLMTCDGELCEIEKTEENGIPMYRARIVGKNGNIELLCDGEGVPKRISDGKLLVTVIRFEAK